MGQIVGIDLGTSNTVVAHVADAASGDPRPLADADGSTLIPSVVSLDPGGKVLVGHAAKARRAIDPANTVYAAKRLMGRTWSDPELQDARKRLPFQLRRGPNDGVRVMLRGELFTLPEISAFVLRKAKAVAEAALGDAVDRAVVTVPANFNELQRNATKLAGTLANLDVVRVLNEPTAAALAYGYGTGASERIAVYDFGGGTFDLSLLSVFEDVFRVRATAGDMFLGGDDVDFAIANAMADAFLRKHYYDARAHPEVFDQLREAAQRLKVMLSTQTEATLQIPGLIHAAFGREVDFTYTMTRAEIEAIIEPFVARTMSVCESTFAKVKVPPSAFDKIVLVGGSTRIPLVRRRVAEFFKRDPETSVDPDEVVALGAAVQALAMQDVAARPRLRSAARPRASRTSERVDFGALLGPPASTPSVAPPMLDADASGPYQSIPPPPAPAARAPWRWRPTLPRLPSLPAFPPLSAWPFWVWVIIGVFATLGFMTLLAVVWGQ